MSYLELMAAARGQTWAIQPSFLEAALSEAAAGDVRRRVRLPRVDGAVAIIPVHGMITQRGSIFDGIFGGTSTMAFEAAFSRAVSSNRIGAVVLDDDSPGGTTSGVELAADRVFAARGSKPIVAVANSLAASSAFWIGSSADTFVAAPGADVGSIGVFRMHEDHSAEFDKAGVNIDFIAVPEFKTEGNPFESLSDAGRAHQMAQVQETFNIFNKAVARNRGVTPAFARDNFGGGRTFHANQALTMGLVDGVKSLEQVVRELGVGTGRATLTTAQSQDIETELCAAWESGVVDYGCVCDVDTSIPTDKLRRRLDIKEREIQNAVDN